MAIDDTTHHQVRLAELRALIDESDQDDHLFDAKDVRDYFKQKYSQMADKL